MSSDDLPPPHWPGEQRRRDEAGSPPDGLERRQSERRRLERLPAPMTGVGVITGELRDGDGRRWPFKVWDFNVGGLCVIVSTSTNLPQGTPLQVQIEEAGQPLGPPLPATLCWTTQVGSSLFWGLGFSAPLREGPFYERYLRQPGPARHPND
jgi:hypothetical protein